MKEFLQNSARTSLSYEIVEGCPPHSSETYLKDVHLKEVSFVTTPRYEGCIVTVVNSISNSGGSIFSEKFENTRIIVNTYPKKYQYGPMAETEGKAPTENAKVETPTVPAPEMPVVPAVPPVVVPPLPHVENTQKGLLDDEERKGRLRKCLDYLTTVELGGNGPTYTDLTNETLANAVINAADLLIAKREEEETKRKKYFEGVKSTLENGLKQSLGDESAEKIVECLSVLEDRTLQNGQDDIMVFAMTKLIENARGLGDTEKTISNKRKLSDMEGEKVQVPRAEGGEELMGHFGAIQLPRVASDVVQNARTVVDQLQFDNKLGSVLNRIDARNGQKRTSNYNERSRTLAMELRKQRNG